MHYEGAVNVKRYQMYFITADFHSRETSVKKNIDKEYGYSYQIISNKRLFPISKRITKVVLHQLNIQVASSNMLNC